MPRKTFTNDVENLLSPRLSKLESASLRLDKYTFIGDNSKKDQIQAVCDLSRRRSTSPPFVLKGDMSFSMRLGGRMMVNMAGGVLENSGLCLHHFFNHPMIPGSALKGIAGHAAWIEWRKFFDGNKISEAKSVAEQMIGVFGFPTGSKDIDGFIEKHCQLSIKKTSLAGTIAFLPAIPKDNNWRLTPDVLTPHGGNDYSNPVPSFFIAVEKGAEFTFSIKKTARASDEQLDIASTWLKKGLVDSGAGAKTAAGYGFFLPESYEAGDLISLKLATPGFFGGAEHASSEDTLLRTASLRGMLRWWWRTLYRGLLSDKEISKLEDQIWGSTSTGKSLILIKIVAEDGVKAELFDYKDRFVPKPTFKVAHDLMDGARGTTQGLFYLSYGMDEIVQQKPRRRYYIDTGASWNLCISANSGKSKLSVEDIRNQAIAALSLLCNYGGIGSKSRKGFGSLLWGNAWHLEKCLEEAKVFCDKYDIPIQKADRPYSWSTAMAEDIAVPWKDPWAVIDRLGFAIQSFAQKYKHEECKAVLGLPRKIHGPIPNRPIGHQRQETHQNPENLYPDLREANNGKNTRFASPIWYHVEPSGSGSTIRVTAFPSDMIRDINTSKEMYLELIEHIRGKLVEYARAPRQGSSPSPSSQGQRNSRPERQRFQPATSDGYKAGEKVKAILLDEKTKKGGWKAQVEGTEILGPIQNNDKVPASCTPGQYVELVLKIAKGNDSAFAWPEA